MEWDPRLPTRNSLLFFLFWIRVSVAADCLNNRCDVPLLVEGFRAPPSPITFCGKTGLTLSVINILRKPIPLFQPASILWYRVICHIDQFPADSFQLGRSALTVTHYVALRRRDNGRVIAANLAQIFLQFTVCARADCSINIIVITLA